jgi:carbon monoxide dehydrogenase subunit G
LFALLESSANGVSLLDLTWLRNRLTFCLRVAHASDSKKITKCLGGTLQFQKEVEITAPREKVWQFIWDVDRFIACVPGCKDAKTVEEGKRYTATMVEKVGPFKVEFPTTIEVLEREELSHIKAQASGADNKIGSRMKVDLDVSLRAQDNKTILAFVAGVDILGKLAALGHGIIKRKADQVLDQFAQAVKHKLEEDS